MSITAGPTTNTIHGLKYAELILEHYESLDYYRSHKAIEELREELRPQVQQHLSELIEFLEQIEINDPQFFKTECDSRLRSSADTIINFYDQRHDVQIGYDEASNIINIMTIKYSNWCRVNADFRRYVERSRRGWFFGRMFR